VAEFYIRSDSCSIQGSQTMEKCLFCSVDYLKAYAKRFCSKICYKRWHYREYYRKEQKCIRCGKVYMRDKRTENPLCHSCITSENNLNRHMGGDANPNWRGGSSQWQSGKLGRDKDGLSWKTQRRLCWERDHFNCQDCGKTREELGYKPHVHHIKPYRLSFSHALSNLKSLCRSCHKKAEAQIKELWGGQSFGGSVGRALSTPRVPCVVCGSLTRKKNDAGYCEVCFREKRSQEAKTMIEQGIPRAKIAATFGVDVKTIYSWYYGQKQDPTRIS